MSYPVSTSIHLFFDHSGQVPLNDQIKRHIDAGFRYLDFNFLDWQNLKNAPFVGPHWRDWIQRAGEFAHEMGATFNQAHGPVPCLDCAHDLALYRELCIRAFEGCAILGIPWMVFHNTFDPQQYGSSLSPMAFNIQFFRELLPYAHRYQVGIAIENQWPIRRLDGSAYCTVEDQIELIDAIDDPLVGACWDTGHGNLTGNGENCKSNSRPELLQYSDQYQNITKLGHRLKALHINDNNGHDDDHIAPFGGIIRWRDVLRALDDIHYSHSFTFEAHNAVKRLPECMRDEAAARLHQIGVYLVNMDRTAAD